MLICNLRVLYQLGLAHGNHTADMPPAAVLFSMALVPDGEAHFVAVADCVYLMAFCGPMDVDCVLLTVKIKIHWDFIWITLISYY